VLTPTREIAVAITIGPRRRKQCLMRAIATDGVAWSVSRCVSVSVLALVRPAKMDEPIEMSLVAADSRGLQEPSIRCGCTFSPQPIDSCAAVMRPLVKLL